MNKSNFETPIVYFIFNRPECTIESFNSIRIQKPSQLFIIADGPRTIEENIKCQQVRNITEYIDWPCEVRRNYSEINLGLKERVSSGLNWAFSIVEKAIILEDDCIAHPDFFTFCDSLLSKYENDPRVSVITGNNFQNGTIRGDGSYYFSKYNHCWGWATWRYSWELYDGQISFWNEFSNSDKWKTINLNANERRYWHKIFMQSILNQVDSWAYPWTASIWYKGGLTITPNINLVSNIGFGNDSTHTNQADSPFSKMKTGSIGSIIHPKNIIQDQDADLYVFNHNFGGRYNSFPGVLFWFPYRVFRYLYRILNK
jgi:hypothetical protein